MYPVPPQAGIKPWTSSKSRPCLALATFFLGLENIGEKGKLSTSGLPYMAPAFNLPEDKTSLLDYVQENPTKLFLTKSPGHAGISMVKNVTERVLKDEKMKGISHYFYQEFVDNPYLIEGKMIEVTEPGI